MIREDWDSVQSSATEDEDETIVRSFGKMCAFSYLVFFWVLDGFLGMFWLWF